jgi:deoxyribonuclease V
MKIPAPPHRWDVTPRQAIAIQQRLAARVRKKPPRGPIRLVAGLDAALSPGGEFCIAAAVLWDARDGVVAEQRVARVRLAFPYVPGLLSFREAPAALAALRRLRGTPDALICDGHGLAHPRRFGLACHVGVIVGLPTIGCAKSRLIGEHAEPAARRGSVRALMDGRERIGTVLRTRDGVRPVFISVGHRVDLATARRVVLRCATGYRLPEPTRLADRRVAAVKREGTVQS